MLTRMHAKTTAACLLAVLTLSACVSPRRSVVVETDRNGIPVHASGTMREHSYTVVRGDTLYSIAFRAGADYRDVARWNGIDAPYLIHPGQRLRLSPPARAASTARPAPVGVPSRPVFKPVPSKPATPPHAPVRSVAKGATGVAAAASTTVAVAGEAAPRPTPPRPHVDVPRAATRSIGGIAWRWPADGALINGFHANDAIPGIEIAGSAGDAVRAAADGVVVYSGNGLVGYGELIIIKHNDTYLSAYGHNRQRLVKEGERVQAGQVIAEMGSSGAPRNELQFQIRREGKPVDPMQFLPSR